MLPPLFSFSVSHDQFAWVGGFSAAVQQRGFDAKFPTLSAASAKLRLLRVAVGENAELRPPNEDFVAWAKGRGFAVTPVEIPGKHTWLVWRDNLVHFAPLLFR